MNGGYRLHHVGCERQRCEEKIDLDGNYSLISAWKTFIEIVT